MRLPALPPKFACERIDPAVVMRLLARGAATLPDGRYLHWDTFRRRPPPSGLTPEEAWFAQKLGRMTGRTAIPGFFDQAGKPFTFCRLDELDRATHALDRQDAARGILETMGDEAARHRYRIDQLIEEAISSSLVEGAKLTTRAQAKALLQTGSAPRSHGEKMVVNNYQAMQRLLSLTDKDLTLDDLLEVHGILGADALEAPHAGGRLRTASDEVHVVDSLTGDVWFVPPPAAELRERLARMLEFANDRNPKKFVHPLVRAIVLHFWLAYLHPFVDGNGRMARALFYWQMLRAGYDFAQYLSISGPIDRAPRDYYLAFAYVETDEGDLTYFILHQLTVLRQATDALIAHVRERMRVLKTLSSVFAEAESLNDRQRAVLAFLARDPAQGATIQSHAGSHAVSYLTARKDLQDLEALGLLRRVRAGRTDRYLPAHVLMAKVAKVAP